jgi:hypothetical protein
MCCRVFPIPEANKHHADWCAQLERGQGCRIYAQRPAPCRAFHCLWLRDENLSDDWRPDRAGFVLSDPEPWALLVTCDPDQPSAWRREPYQSAIRTWARAAELRAAFTGAREGGRLTLVFADRDVPLEDEGGIADNGAS